MMLKQKEKEKKTQRMSDTQTKHRKVNRREFSTSLMYLQYISIQSVANKAS